MMTPNMPGPVIEEKPAGPDEADAGVSAAVTQRVWASALRASRGRSASKSLAPSRTASCSCSVGALGLNRRRTLSQRAAKPREMLVSTSSPP